MSCDNLTSRAMILVLITTFLVLGSCSSETSKPLRTVADVRTALIDRTQDIVIGGEDGPLLVLAPELSARVLAVSFAGDESENLFWLNDSIYDGTYFNTRPYQWNAGGYRTWLAPEDIFFFDADGEWFVPVQLDPTPYRVVEKNSFAATLEADINLKTNIINPVTNLEIYYQVTIRRRISLLDEPPAKIRGVVDDMEYVGIDISHSLTNRAEDIIGTDIPSICLRNLLQLEPSGTVHLPLKSGADAETSYREYYEPLGNRLAVQGNILSMKVDGEYRSKIGIRPDAVGNGIAYLRELGDRTGVLYVMMSTVDPDGIYVDKPLDDASDYGDAIELYNDDGQLGGFAEIGYSGPAHTLGRGETMSHTVTLHIFSGSIEKLLEVGSLLLGANLIAAYNF